MLQKDIKYVLVFQYLHPALAASLSLFPAPGPSCSPPGLTTRLKSYPQPVTLPVTLLAYVPFACALVSWQASCFATQPAVGAMVLQNGEGAVPEARAPRRLR
eukprot:6189769-Pleurochrysis_carterae.AAC.1